MATLLQFVELLGPTVLSVAVAPAGLDVLIPEAALYDALDPCPPPAGALLLGIGLATDARSIVDSLRGRPAALVLKHDGRFDDAVLAEATGTGVALLTLSAGASWIRVAELAQALTADQVSLDVAASPTSSELLQDLFEVANAIAARVGAPITIEDTQSRLLAYSAQDHTADAARAATVLGHRVPPAYRAEVRRLGIAKRLLTETSPIYFAPDLPEVSPRMVLALRAGGQVLGSMWAIAEGPFDEARAAAFAEAGQAVSVRVWQHRITTRLQREQRAQAMTLILAGGLAAVELGRRSGLDGGSYRLLAASLMSGTPERRRQLDRVLEVASAQASVTHPAALTADVADVVYIVLPASPDPSQAGQDALEMTTRLRQSLPDDLRSRVVVARSGHCTSLAEMDQARDEVQAVLRVLTTGASRRLDAEIQQVGLQVMLQRMADLQAGRPLLRNAVVDTIAAHDAQHGTDYLPTLEAHLASFGDVATASSQLHVHTNTFRYRLKRLGELFDLDLDDPDVRFSLMLQFRLARS